MTSQASILSSFRSSIAMLLFAGFGLAPAQAAESLSLTLEERVEAQRAIEGVYARHRSSRPGGILEPLPSAALEAKVIDSLRKSAALEIYWSTPVDDRMLTAELERIVRDSRMPERLSELFGALGDDPVLIKETLVRSLLVDRLARRFHATDPRWAPVPEIADRSAGLGDADRRWDAWWSEVSPDIEVSEVAPVAESGSSIKLDSVDGDDCAPGEWSNGTLDDVPDARQLSTAVWTGSEMIVWGGYNGSVVLDTGGRYDPATDSWTPVTRVGGPVARFRHSAVWAGDRMIVFGGRLQPAGDPTDTGASYDPVTDVWTPLPKGGAPSARRDHTAVWTGTEMIVWGGQELDGTGARYNPSTDTWTPISNVNDPTGRFDHTAIWTGTEMLVWGGVENFFPNNRQNTGGRYNPATDTWVPTNLSSAPLPRALHTAVWSGSEMIVWGGENDEGVTYSSGGIYDPAGDSWTATPANNAPTARDGHVAVWTGSEMVVWGGVDLGGNTDTGASLTLQPRKWSAITTLGAPEARTDAVAVWDGTRMLVWSGAGLRLTRTGGRYAPGTDSWTPTSVGDAPSQRRDMSTVWTGTELIVWGGSSYGELDTGGRYDPALDSWSPTSTVGAPSPRGLHAAEWASGRMVVWGGTSLGDDTGARYDPATDSWLPITATGAPTARRSHTAIVHDGKVHFWGGSFYDGGGVGTIFRNDGAIYDPSADSWSAMTTSGAPSGRRSHTAVSTGTEMIVWGGEVSGGFTQSGGRYDFAAGTWQALDDEAANIPTPRVEHTAVWTGSEMIVWGGDDTLGNSCSSGGRYDPVTDTWAATEHETAETPSPRRDHVALWNGSEMLIWGGRTPASPQDDFPEDGGAYDPLTNSWTVIDGSDAPSGRNDLAAVFVDSELIVWGGSNGVFSELASGGRYCGCAALDFFSDGDGDGFGDPSTVTRACVAPGGFVTDGSDCDDGNIGAWGAPGEVGGVTFTDRTTIVWSSPGVPGATSVRYDVLRTTDVTDFDESATCVSTDQVGESFQDVATPAPGSLFAYVVRAKNDCPGGTGTIGNNSSGAARFSRSCP